MIFFILNYFLLSKIYAVCWQSNLQNAAACMKDNNKINIWKVISASSVGTLIEWYDFYIFGSLATIISEKFFPSTNPTTAFLATLA